MYSIFCHKVSVFIFQHTFLRSIKIHTYIKIHHVNRAYFAQKFVFTRGKHYELFIFVFTRGKHCEPSQAGRSPWCGRTSTTASPSPSSPVPPSFRSPGGSCALAGSLEPGALTPGIQTRDPAPLYRRLCENFN